MKTALWFSGGKDSLACLYLLKDKWNATAVLWANTGKNFPEVLATIEKVKNMVPNFVELTVDKTLQNAVHGIPSAVVPINFTKYSETLTGKQAKYYIQPYLDCCRANIATPLFNWCKANGITQIYKGQRNDEDYVSPSKNGTVLDGIEFIQPIESWTRNQVTAFLETEMGELPEHLHYEHSSMDCYDCTAYLEHAGERVTLMKSKYPVWHLEFQTKLGAIASAVAEDTLLINSLAKVGG